MKSQSYKNMIEEYQFLYGNVPSDKSSILSFIEKTYKFKDKDYDKIKLDNEASQGIPWESLTIILPIIPKPSPRPRYSGVSGHFYVTGAAENKKLFKYYIKDIYDIIYTQTHFSIETYLPTPVKSMTRHEIYRAEQGNIRPISNPDWDNLGKTYSDMIQNILILNDNIITDGVVKKYYSIKPRVVIHIEYQQGYDSKFNKKRIQHSTSYKNAVEVGNIIEVYTERNDVW